MYEISSDVVSFNCALIRGLHSIFANLFNLFQNCYHCRIFWIALSFMSVDVRPELSVYIVYTVLLRREAVIQHCGRAEFRCVVSAVRVLYVANLDNLRSEISALIR